jgi:SAM-dependent methyltransferase
VTSSPRWFTDTADDHSQRYIRHFRSLAEDGADLAGEARLVDAMVAPQSRILDAGCGPGRTGAVLYERGHHVVGVDVDPELIEAARTDHPGPRWLLADLATLDLASLGEPDPFDAAVVAGNVMAYVAPDTEEQVLRRIRHHLRPDGFAIIGFHTERYGVAGFDTHLAEAGFTLEHRFATWDLRPWHPDADFAVSVLRRPLEDSHE